MAYDDLPDPTSELHINGLAKLYLASPRFGDNVRRYLARHLPVMFTGEDEFALGVALAITHAAPEQLAQFAAADLAEMLEHCGALAEAALHVLPHVRSPE